MSSVTLERTFSVDAPPGRVWGFLKEPSLVVTCLPGAALLSSSEDGLRHEGTVTVKLGTLGVSYRGTAELVDIDDDARRLSVQANGREKAGAGSARMSMTSTVYEKGDGSAVAIEASIDVTGKIVSLGRGMIGVVSEQVLSDFATNLSGKVSATAATPAASSATETDETPSATAPANALSIFFRAIWARLKRLFTSV